MDEMASHMSEMVATMSGEDESLRNADSGLADLKGDMIELKMPNKVVPPVCDKFALRAGRIVRGGQPTGTSIKFGDLLYDAYKSGAIDERERDRITMTDLIISAVSRKTKMRAYVAVEASFVIDVRDVTRARDGADILAKAFPYTETYPAVYGVIVNPEGRAAADRLGVSIYVAQVDMSARHR